MHLLDGRPSNASYSCNAGQGKVPLILSSPSYQEIPTIEEDAQPSSASHSRPFLCTLLVQTQISNVASVQQWRRTVPIRGLATALDASRIHRAVCHSWSVQGGQAFLQQSWSQSLRLVVNFGEPVYGAQHLLLHRCHPFPGIGQTPGCGSLGLSMPLSLEGNLNHLGGPDATESALQQYPEFC